MPIRLTRIRFVLVGGGRIHLEQYCTRVDELSTLEEFLRPVAQALDWRVSHISLTLNHVTVAYTARISQRTRTNILSLVSDRDDSLEPVTVTVYKFPPPTDFRDYAGCMCDFGGCCCNCSVQSSTECWGCGNNGCCRSGNCGHPCCEIAEVRPNQGCPISGCKPWWAK